MKFWTLEILGFIWALPVTLIGLVLVLISGGGEFCSYRPRYPLRWEIHPRWPWWMFMAGVGMGAFVFLKGDISSDQLRIHELEHTRQCFILGPFVLVLYPLFSLVSLVCYGSIYKLNWLEIMARVKDGRAKV